MSSRRTPVSSASIRSDQGRAACAGSVSSFETIPLARAKGRNASRASAVSGEGSRRSTKIDCRASVQKSQVPRPGCSASGRGRRNGARCSSVRDGTRPSIVRALKRSPMRSPTRNAGGPGASTRQLDRRACLQAGSTAARLSWRAPDGARAAARRARNPRAARPAGAVPRHPTTLDVPTEIRPVRQCRMRSSCASAKGRVPTLSRHRHFGKADGRWPDPPSLAIGFGVAAPHHVSRSASSQASSRLLMSSARSYCTQCPAAPISRVRQSVTLSDNTRAITAGSAVTSCSPQASKIGP